MGVQGQLMLAVIEEMRRRGHEAEDGFTILHCDGHEILMSFHGTHISVGRNEMDVLADEDGKFNILMVADQLEYELAMLKAARERSDAQIAPDVRAQADDLLADIRGILDPLLAAQAALTRAQANVAICGTRVDSQRLGDTWDAFHEAQSRAEQELVEKMLGRPIPPEVAREIWLEDSQK